MANRKTFLARVRADAMRSASIRAAEKHADDTEQADETAAQAEVSGKIADALQKATAEADAAVKLAEAQDAAA